MPDLDTQHAALFARVTAVLADLERVPEPHLDNPGADHWERCWKHHAGCLAARITATLTGEDPTDAR